MLVFKLLNRLVYNYWREQIKLFMLLERVLISLQYKKVVPSHF
jgi:hypothetical protein